MKQTRLSTPAKFNQFVVPIALATECINDGSMCSIAGFGNTNTLNRSDTKKPHSPVIAENTCRSYFPGMITINMLCIGNRGGCKIIKGTPVECAGELQGIFSWDNTDPLYEPSSGVGVLTRICAFYHWITDEMASH